jgi:exodeoxyribonuclease VII small subunit
VSDEPRPVEELGFEEARTELEAIVAAIDDGDIDIDTLSTKVARAGALLLHCRDRIIATRTQVEDIVADIDHAWGTNGSTVAPEEPF